MTLAGMPTSIVIWGNHNAHLLKQIEKDIMKHSWKENRYMNCTLCEAEVDGIEEAIEKDWVPYFYVNDDEYGPVCSECFKKYLQFDAEGECEMHPAFINTFLASSSSKLKTEANGPKPYVETSW